MEDIEKTAENVQTKQDFITFIEAMQADLIDNPSDWQNKNLLDFLEALGRWTEDMDGYYINHNLPIPENVSWNVFTDILMAARIYE